MQFVNEIGIPTILGQGAPSFRELIAEMCHLYRRMHHRRTTLRGVIVPGGVYFRHRVVRVITVGEYL